MQEWHQWSTNLYLSHWQTSSILTSHTISIYGLWKDFFGIICCRKSYSKIMQEWPQWTPWDVQYLSQAYLLDCNVLHNVMMWWQSTADLSKVTGDQVDRGGAYGVKRCMAPVLLVNACHRDNVPLEFALLLITAQSWDGIGLFCSPQTHDWAWGLLSLLWALSTFCDGALASRKSCGRRILRGS